MAAFFVDVNNKNSYTVEQGDAMNLTYRPIDFDRDYENVLNITKSSGFFEETEVELAIQYYNENKEKGDGCGHKFLFAELDGKTVGYTNFGMASHSGQSYYIHWIAIDDKYRNKGYGKMLITKTEEIIRDLGAKKIFVETSSKEAYRSTQQFYLKCGYVIEATLKKFYAEDDHQLIFSKEV
jgi:GNAT superfamily N-acetyltransferase